VSIVMATYNYGRFLGDALDSVFAQSLPDFELIVVDDGSTDDTPTVAGRFLADPRFRYVRAAHLGHAVAKNTAIRLARAPLIAFLDADDIWLPNKLQMQVTKFAADPGVGLIYARRVLMNEAGNDLPTPERTLRRGRILPDIFRDNFICFSSAMVRREALETAGLFDESLPLAVDYDIWLRVLTDWRADFIDEPLVRYRTGHANLSRRVEERLHIAIGIMRRFLNERGGRRRLSRSLVRRAWAETFCNLGLFQRRRSRIGAIGCFLRSLVHSPSYLRAWKGLFTLMLPEICWSWLRRAFGRPDWTAPRPASGAVVPIAVGGQSS
jgi:glycosyltransferase involved in cell wall biosynthesis